MNKSKIFNEYHIVYARTSEGRDLPVETANTIDAASVLREVGSRATYREGKFFKKYVFVYGDKQFAIDTFNTR